MRYRVVPGEVTVQVKAPDVDCGAHHRDIPVKVHIHNDSADTLRITIDNRPGPPYKLSWLSYEVIDDDGNVDWEHGAGDHGPLPQPTLKIGPGDRTVLLAMLYGIDAADDGRRFRIRVQDEAKRTWTTEAFSPCAATSPD